MNDSDIIIYYTALSLNLIYLKATRAREFIDGEQEREKGSGEHVTQSSQLSVYPSRPSKLKYRIQI